MTQSLPDRTRSLIAAGNQQLDLIPPDKIEAACASIERLQGEYTARRVFDNEPDRYRLIVTLLAEGHGILRVARLAKASPSTVSEIRDRESVEIQNERMQIVSDGRRAAKLCIEGVIEDICDPERRDKISARDKSIIAGVLIDKSELLSGGVTQRVQLEQGPGVDDYRQLLAAAIERARDTGLAAQVGGQKDLAPEDVRVGPAPGSAVPSPGPDGVTHGTQDAQSSVEEV